MSLESQEQQLRKSREAERVVEAREAREKEMTPEDKAVATRERADYLVKEVKSGKQQIQNIMVHMQQVMQAISALRQQLQLAGDDQGTAVVQDQKQINKLKEKIKDHKDELLKMKDELISAQAEEIRNGEGASLSEVGLRNKAEEMVERIMEAIEE